METVIQAVGLTKRYNRRTVVDRINMTVRRGDIYGFLGRNGAGKTTTLRMMLGLIKPSAGRAEVFGTAMAPNRVDILRRVGCLIETPGFYPNLTARENLDVLRLMSGIRDPRCIAEALQLVGLEDDARKMVGAYSLGMKQRLGLAGALLHRPEILILDEPVNGLDPHGIREIRDLIRRLAAEKGITVLMSSHILGEVQQLANRLGVIHDGYMIEELDLAELRRRSRACLEVKVDQPARALRLIEEKLGIREYETLPDGLLRLFDGLDRAAALNAVLVQNEVAVSGLTLREENLEDHFIRLTGGEDRVGMHSC